MNDRSAFLGYEAAPPFDFANYADTAVEHAAFGKYILYEYYSCINRKLTGLRYASLRPLGDPFALEAPYMEAQHGSTPQLDTHISDQGLALTRRVYVQALAVYIRIQANFQLVTENKRLIFRILPRLMLYKTSTPHPRFKAVPERIVLTSLP